MEQPISISCCIKRAKRYPSHVKVRRQRSCQWFVIPDGTKRLLEQKQHASTICIIHESYECGLRHFVVESVVLLLDDESLLRDYHALVQSRNPFQASLIIPSYAIS